MPILPPTMPSVDSPEPTTVTDNPEPLNIEPPPLPDPYTAQFGFEFENDFNTGNVDWSVGQGMFVEESYGYCDVSNQYFQDNIQYPAPPRQKKKRKRKQPPVMTKSIATWNANGFNTASANHETKIESAIETVLDHNNDIKAICIQETHCLDYKTIEAQGCLILHHSYHLRKDRPSKKK